MITINDIIQVDKIDGVVGFILVDDKGAIISQNLKDSEKMSKLVFICLKNAMVIAKTRLKYLCLSRKNKNDVYIFPVGKFGLGVVKQDLMNDVIFAQNIIQFLNKLITR